MIRELACLGVGFVAGFVVGADAVLIVAEEAMDDHYAGWSESGDHY